MLSSRDSRSGPRLRAPRHGNRTTTSLRAPRPSLVFEIRPSRPSGRWHPRPDVTSPAPDLILRSGLRKRFGARQAVDGVTFEIGRGETYGLLGPNGAGKTTTISMVCGILARDGGERRRRRPADRHRHGRGEGARSATCHRTWRSTRISRLARTSGSSAGLYGLGGRPLAKRIDAVLELVGSHRPSPRPDRAATRAE